jgi:hypothetical protein
MAEKTYGDIITGGYNWLYDAGIDAADAFWQGADNLSSAISSATEGIKTPEVGLLDTVPGNYFTQDNWFPKTPLMMDEEQNYAIPYVPPSPNTSNPDVIDYASGDPWHTMGSPNNNLTATGSGAVTQRPWKQDEIDINAVGTHNSYNRGYDNVGNLKDGWALGIDNIPYNKALSSLNNSAISSAGGGGYGGGGGGSVPSAPVLNPQTFPFNSRTPSGSVYAPDMSAYNDSSLFNYTGPGGTNEYTYGQGLPTQGAGYDIWGSPSNIANPYFSGQFATEPTGPADAAINMPAVEMPAGVPGIGGSGASSTNQPSMPGFTGGGNVGGGGTGPDGKDLTYQETIDYFGLTPTSTTFPGPNDKVIEEQKLNENAVKQTLNDYGMTWNDGIGYDGLIDNKLLYGKDGSFNINQFDDGRARFNYLFNKDLDLGRPGDASYEEFVANPALFTTATRGDGSDNESFDTPAFTGNDTVSATPYVGNAGRGTVVEEPGLRAANSTPQLDEIVQNYKTDQYNRSLFRDAILNPSDDDKGSPVYGGLDGLPGEFGLHNQEPYNKAAFDFAGKPEERSIWKGDEIDIQTPFRPEGVEGEDFYEGNDGNFYATHDDLGLEPLSPIENKPLYQIPDRTYGDVNANTVASDYAGFEGTRNMPSVYDLPEDSYEREVYLGQIPAESTSDILTEQEFNDGKQGFLNIIKEGFESINAKYKGSTTDESAEAELGEIISVIAGSYAANDEGTDTGELSTRDLVTPSLVYTGSGRATGGEAREGQKSGRGDGLGKSLHNQALMESIFTKPEPAPLISSGPSLFVPNNFQAQIKPSVAKTQNNMTVPIKRDEKLTARYGQPYRRYGL